MNYLTWVWYKLKQLPLYFDLEHTNVEDECRLSVSTKKVGEEATEFAKLSRKPYAKVYTVTEFVVYILEDVHVLPVVRGFWGQGHKSGTCFEDW